MIRLLRLYLPFFLGVLLSSSIHAQQLPEVLKQVLKADTSFNSLKCKIKVHVEVPGLNIPDKEVLVELQKGKEPKLKTEGMVFFPKRGIIGQYREFLESKSQSILISEKTDTLVYKLVSLDNSSDWVTADFTVSKRDYKVHEMLISTRKNGEYKVKHKYNTKAPKLPEKTEISFEAMPVKFPLKFLGQKSTEPSILNSDDPVNGKVFLYYSQMVIN